MFLKILFISFSVIKIFLKNHSHIFKKNCLQRGPCYNSCQTIMKIYNLKLLCFPKIVFLITHSFLICVYFLFLLLIWIYIIVLLCIFFVIMCDFLYSHKYFTWCSKAWEMLLLMWIFHRIHISPSPHRFYDTRVRSYFELRAFEFDDI